MREDIQMKNAVDAISHFDNRIPLHLYLKQFFRAHKNMGSRDRKILSAIVFGYYRFRGNHRDGIMEKTIAAGASKNPQLKEFYNYWKDQLKMAESDAEPELENYFPLGENISDQVDQPAFIKSHFSQPGIWIRCRKNKLDEIVEELEALKYEFEIHEDQAILFSQSYPLTEMKCYGKGYFELQDIASQHTLEVFHPVQNEVWWDCCAGAGGKSLMLLDEQPHIKLFVSDVRESILHNLKERFLRNGFQDFHLFNADLSDPTAIERLPDFDAILADVPCSGSGTWGRTPEWLTYFTRGQLQNYILLQRKIVSAATRKLKQGGKLIYLTCSVYADENEKNVRWFAEKFQLEIKEERYFQYSKEGGDTMFGARLKKI